MSRLPDAKCPECGELIRDCRPDAAGRAPVATGYEACLRRCDKCGVGVSNAKDKDAIVVIYREPRQNVPGNVHGGLCDALHQALHVQNRPNKKAKFCFQTSEDAVTWTVFRGLQQEGLLRLTLAYLGFELAEEGSDEPAMLLWGVPVPASDDRAQLLRQRLLSVSDELKERAQSRSEPDVVLDVGEEGLVLVEVKYNSGNDVRELDYDRFWRKYVEETRAFGDGKAAQKTGLYELARNWRIAWELAGDRPMWLLNLGPGELFEGTKAEALQAFKQCLKTGDKRRFLWRTWRKFLPDVPQWLCEYLEQRMPAEMAARYPVTGGQIEAMISIPGSGTIEFSGLWDDGQVKLHIPQRLRRQMADASKLFDAMSLHCSLGYFTLKDRPYTKDWFGLLGLVDLMHEVIPEYTVTGDLDELPQEPPLAEGYE